MNVGLAIYRALRAINLESTDKIPLLNTIGGSSFAEKLSGVSRRERNKHIRAFHEALDVDLSYSMAFVSEECKYRWEDTLPEQTVYGSYEDFRGDYPYTDLWHIAYKGCEVARSPASTILWVTERPFKEYRELLSYLREYDPRECEVRSVREISAHYRECWERQQRLLEGVTLVAGELYLTLFTFFIVHVGWKFMARLIYQNPELLDEALARYAEVSKKHMEAWSRVGIKAFVCHDDIATQLGPMVNPDWYWEHVFPIYRELWRPLKRKGIKIIFISDGNYTPLIEGLAWAGADGFKINPDAKLGHSELESLLDRYGGRKIFSLSVRRDIMMHGTEKDVVSELRFIMSLAKRYNGVFIHQEEEGKHFDAYYKTWVENRVR